MSTISSCEFCHICLCKFACWTNKNPAKICLPQLWMKITPNSVKCLQSCFFCCCSWFLDYFVRCIFCLLHSKYSYFIFQRERKRRLENFLYSYASTNSSFSLRINNVFQEKPSFFSFLLTCNLGMVGWQVSRCCS